MKKIVGAAVLLSSTASGVFAGGLDRSGQPIGVIFEEGNYAEFNFGHISPSVSGTDLLANPISNVADSFVQLSFGIKKDLSDRLSGALIVDQPYGSDVTYGGDPGTTFLGGTQAIADSLSVTALGRYKLDDRFSVHGGIRYQQVSGNITLSGLAYGGLSGYNVDLATGSDWGYVVGGAYEIPDIALRVALTYQSEITHDLPTVENIALSSPDTEIVSPASINLDFQTGIAEDTLLFGGVRYQEWSKFIISPATFDALVDPGIPNSSISDLDDSTSYTIGVGRRFNERFSGSISIGYEGSGADDLVSPLAPSNGSRWVTLGGRYSLDNGVTISGGIRYTQLGDARPETGTPDVARADFTDNDAISVGFKVGYNF